MAGHDIDDLFGEAVVAWLTIKLRRNGAMSVEGHVNDEPFAKYLLETARDTVANYHARLKLGQVGGVIVPAYDTALVGTPEERKLMQAHEKLVGAQETLKDEPLP
jgi:hypothetical protein